MVRRLPYFAAWQTKYIALKMIFGSWMHVLQWYTPLSKTVRNSCKHTKRKSNKKIRESVISCLKMKYLRQTCTIAEPRISRCLIWHNHQNGKCLKKHILTSLENLNQRRNNSTATEYTKKSVDDYDNNKEKYTRNKKHQPCWQLANEITTADFGELC